MGDRSIRETARLAGLSHAALVRYLAGETWPDLYAIARLEAALGLDLWPGRPR
ncbi:helix-turn-helix domain-containing protein [Agromyces sp. NPDC058104]|uniref:helix-turn-helix domain-containing protein n=1 Tax=Agromyces sp. NPDC058104 TaxID=3346342 RepID=UPI0036DCE513